MARTKHSQGHSARDDRSIRPGEVRPGMVVRNPYGGAHGRAVVASEPRERPDGTIEFDTEDGRTGVFRPHFRLHLDRAATGRLAQQRDTQRPDAPPNTPRTTELGRTTGPQAASEAEPGGRTMLGVTGDGKDAQTVTTDGPVTGLGEPRTDKARSWTTQAIADAINRNPLHTGRQPEHSNVTGDGQKTQTVTTHGPITSISEPKTGTAAAAATRAVLDAINSGQLRAEQLDDCGFWAAKAAQQHGQAETETDHGPEREA